jgi:hypothetical protein
MARKTWTQEEVNALEKRIRDKVQRKEKLTTGEDTVWGVLRNNKPLTTRFIEEVDFMMGFEE